jgi:hypothetical protein
MVEKMRGKGISAVFLQVAQHTVFYSGGGGAMDKSSIVKVKMNFSNLISFLNFKHVGGPQLRYKESSHMRILQTFLVRMSILSTKLNHALR